MNLVFWANLGKIKSKIYTKIAPLQVSVLTSKEPISFSQIEKDKFKAINIGKTWAKEIYDCAWFCFKGEIPKKYAKENIFAKLSFCGEGSVYDSNGEIIGMITSKACDLEKLSLGKEYVKITEANTEFYVDAGFNGKYTGTMCFKIRGVLEEAFLCTCNNAIKEYYYDYFALALLQSNAIYDDKKNITKALKESYKLFVANDLNSASKVLKSILFAQKSNETANIPTAYAVGHAHLDLAWLWPIRETKRKAIRTLTNALEMIDKNDDYIFGLSQPQILEWVKENNPNLYQKVKKAIMNGRIELQGGMWVECDCNITSGESLIRQIIYGQEFYRKEFGKTCNYCWLPDAFGFNGNLPQILEKTGLKTFSTIKMSWNKVNTFPYTTFRWKGINNESEVIAHFPPEGNYNSNVMPKTLQTAYKKNKNKNVENDFLSQFGVGDGGGGAGEAHIELAKRQAAINVKIGGKEYSPNVKFSSASSFFDKIAAKKNSMPVYQGELYLETHQGTYTTQAKNKLFNRKIEFLLHNLEFLATKNFLITQKYPSELLEKCWKEILLYQFHDILPGSSIHRVYEETDKSYRIINEKLNNALSEFISNDKKDLSMINFTSFNRTEWVRWKDKDYRINIAPYSAKKLEETSATDIQFAYGKDYIENDKLKVVFNNKGEITSLFDKVNNKELCKGKLNKLVLYPDYPLSFNAWNLNSAYDKTITKPLYLKSSKTVVDGAKIVRKNVFTHKNTVIEQDIVLMWNEDYLRFDTKVDWQENNTMLRADFKPSVYSDEVRCDIQFGNIMRKTTNNNSIEKAQFEICAHKYVNLDDKDYGIALINDCKYGHKVKNGKISINLLRSTHDPDKTADRGQHLFSYIVYPHKEKFENSRVTQLAYMLNNPLIITENNIEFDSFANGNNNNIVIETIKKAQDKNAVIIRAYENAGKENILNLKVNFNYKNVYLCNLLEEISEKLDSLDNIKFNPFEIKTFYFEI